MSLVKSPLRYPGGKSRAVKKIAQYMPASFSEYREPFVGGGSFFIYLRQKFPHIPVWINDLNPELFLFWKHLQIDMKKLIQDIQAIKQNTVDGKKLFYQLLAEQPRTDYERAVRFFVLNRISFSGTVESGGFSQGAFEKRFTHSSIERLRPLPAILQNVRITSQDYKQVIHEAGQDVFIFLDPPYFKATKSRLYGKRGTLHTNFNHAEFADAMRECRHQWLITYDDSPEIRHNFAFAHIYEWELQYGMNNYKQGRAAKGQELFICNYEVDPARLENAGKQLALLEKGQTYQKVGKNR